MKKLLLLLLLQTTTSVFFSLNAQSTFTGWLSSVNTLKTGKKTSIHTDIQLRSTDEIKQVQILIIRPAFSVHLNKHLTVTAGYAFVRNKRFAGNISGFMPEHRIWEQLLITHKLKNIFVSYRFRLEQRFIAKSIVVDDILEKDGSVYANRFRYLMRSVLPFKTQPVFKKGLFAVLQDEVFLNFGNVATVNNETFDQNRLYIAIGYRLNARFDLETGYLNQYVNGSNKSFTNNHVAQLAGYLRL